MNEKIKQILILSALILFLIFPYFVFATPGEGDEAGPPTPPTTMKSVLEGLGGAAGYTTEGVNEYSFSMLLNTIINAFLSLLGVIFIILIIYGGYNWMTDRGEEEKVKKAKDTIWRAIVGIIITVGSYAIWNFIFNNFILK